MLNYLDRVDPQAAATARVRYGCLTPWEGDPATYGRATLTGQYRSCEREVVRMLQELTERRIAASVQDGEDLFNAQLNARLVADAEHYYRIINSVLVQISIRTQTSAVIFDSMCQSASSGTAFLACLSAPSYNEASAPLRLLAIFLSRGTFLRKLLGRGTAG